MRVRSRWFVGVLAFVVAMLREPSEADATLVLTRVRVTAKLGPASIKAEVDGESVRWAAEFVAPDEVRGQVVFLLPDGTLTPAVWAPDGRWVSLWEHGEPTPIARGIDDAPPPVMLARR